MARELRYRCDNDDCGHTFVAQLEIIYTVTPSACPRSDVHLRIVGRAAPGLSANDNDEVAPVIVPGGPEVPPLAANDDELLVDTGT